jgi:two-component system chemotaxis response regulator CheB
MDYKAVVIGSSAGGLEALLKVLGALPAGLRATVLVVQHLAPESDDFMARYLNERCPLTVKEADEKEEARPGTVYLAPANYHLLVEEDHTLSLAVTERVNFTRPAADVLFETAAEAFGPELVGIILTGAGTDGSRGLKKIKENGGMTIVQDPATAVAELMPKAAIAATEVDHILPLEKIGPFICNIIGEQDV